MKGVIILPKYLEKLWTPMSGSDGLDFNNILSANAPFFYVMRDTFGFDLKYADEVDVDYDTNVVFMFGVPYHNRPRLIPGLIDLNKNVKLIMWPGDLQCYGDKRCLENKIKVFERCDLIVSPVHEYFVKLYPQFLSKYRFMPKFFSPYNRYVKLPFNNAPKMRCLLSGSLNPQVYPLRSFIKNKGGAVVDYKPPTYKGDSYAKLLNSYFCCVATSSIFNYAVAKYYEITAAGSLLLADETNDLKKAGFVPNQHYIPITKSNAIKTITQCLKNPSDYEHIRREGMKFVRKNHSVNNRMDMFKVVFEEVLNK